MTYIEKDVLLSTDSHPAAGLTYHLADVYVAELTEVCRAGAPSTGVLAALLEPFCQVLAKSSRAAFLPRLRYGLCAVIHDQDKELSQSCESECRMWLQHDKASCHYNDVKAVLHYAEWQKPRAPVWTLCACIAVRQCLWQSLAGACCAHTV